MEGEEEHGPVSVEDFDKDIPEDAHIGGQVPHQQHCKEGGLQEV
eukprot:CAMPEP_0180658508 /NCGR_PEP_ID=MMETSP1037_2-20121125/57040_1 /TAXON_ID=632150 /ORGANISM="Azadinium spinosum, Strain 3D9" /LENGTH=43 /DNA_ID= /DNA_START= /DNA_END= /DNA_ORIENTATION=